MEPPNLEHLLSAQRDTLVDDCTSREVSWTTTIRCNIHKPRGLQRRVGVQGTTSTNFLTSCQKLLRVKTYGNPKPATYRSKATYIRRMAVAGKATLQREPADNHNDDGLVALSNRVASTLLLRHGRCGSCTIKSTRHPLAKDET